MRARYPTGWERSLIWVSLFYAPFGATDITIETTNGQTGWRLCLASMGDTVVIEVTATEVLCTSGRLPTIDQVEYIEKQYAGGKIPGGYFSVKAVQDQKRFWSPD